MYAHIMEYTHKAFVNIPLKNFVNVIHVCKYYDIQLKKC
jgi:hypothetical protein